MFLTGFFDDYDKSIKNKVVEEKFDLVFSRPLGFIIAKALSKIGFTPTNISFLGMIIGVTGGTMLYWQNSLLFTSVGGFLIIISGVFDSADGQAARLYNSHSEMGRYLDLFNDMLVFISCYAAGFHFFVDEYTLAGVWILGLLSGYVHSLKSNIYEWYKGEFLHYSLTDSSQRNDSVQEIKENFDRTTLLRKITYPVLIDYVTRQNKNKFRNDAVTQIFEEARRKKPEAFKEVYVSNSRKMLGGWAWVCGSNVMRNSIIISSLFGRIDIYVLANITSYGLFLLVGKYQNRIDHRILDQIKDWDLNVSAEKFEQARQ